MKYVRMPVAGCMCLVGLLVSTFDIPAYEIKVHYAMNDYIASHEINGFSLEKFLRQKLGILYGIEETVATRVTTLDGYIVLSEEHLTLRKCVAEGGVNEDSPQYRCINHFHDPLKEWGEAGLSDPFDMGESSIVWAQRARGTQYAGKYSWHDIRQHYHEALTCGDILQRNFHLNELFKGLGRIMHLVQDAGVPEHSRNDEHAFSFINYEKYLEKKMRYKEYIRKNDSIEIGPSIFCLPPNALAPLPIARIVDTDRYDGTKPDTTMDMPIGLAEYTNANFFSEDTIFATDTYPYPRWDSVQPAPVAIPDPRGESGQVSRRYLYKQLHGDSGYRLCAEPVLYGEVPDSAEYLAPILDDQVYGDYAERLIPRAITYSAGILKYFFRGNLEISLPSQGFYAFRQNSVDDPRHQGFDKVSVLVRNTSETQEEMTAGTITLVVSYTFLVHDPNCDDPAASALDPFADYRQGSIPSLGRPLYIVKTYDGGREHSIPSSSPVLLEFDLQDTPIPLWAVDVTLTVVYRGRLGGGPANYPVEEDAVCVGYKNTGEPTPLYIVNSTDVVCVDDEWRRTRDVENVSERIVKQLYVQFSPKGSPQDASPSEGYHVCVFTDIEPGTYRWCFLLSDASFNESFYVVERNLTTGSTSTYFSTYGGKSITNGLVYDEEKSTVLRYYPIMSHFRHIVCWNLFFFSVHDVCTKTSCAGCNDEDNPFPITLIE